MKNLENPSDLPARIGEATAASCLPTPLLTPELVSSFVVNALVATPWQLTDRSDSVEWLWLFSA